jgi:hypothetical protein
VYNISLDARKDYYARSLVHSIGVADRTGGSTGQALAEAFPNPFNDQVRVKFDMATSGGDVTFLVRDITGREIHSQVINGVSGTGEFRWVPAADDAEGLYLYEIRSGKQAINGKFILSR